MQDCFQTRKAFNTSFFKISNLDIKMPVSERHYSSDSSISLWQLTEGRKKGSETDNSLILKNEVTDGCEISFWFPLYLNTQCHFENEIWGKMVYFL